MNIYEKLAVVQQELKAPKNQYNSFGKYKYRSCEDILEGLKPCLAKVKAIVQITDEIIQIGERYYIKATVKFHDYEADMRLENTAYAREEDVKKGMDASQVTGAASTYARKYALNGLFCIDDMKDGDSNENNQCEAEKKKIEEEWKKIGEAWKQFENTIVTGKQIEDLKAKCEKDGVQVETILKLYKINTLEELTEKKYRNIHEHWNEIKKAK